MSFIIPEPLPPAALVTVPGFTIYGLVIHIIHNEFGKPSLNFPGETKTTIDAMEMTNILFSVTHIKPAASAVVIIEK